MAGSDTKKSTGRTPKRPVPTIEGTATEVTVEPVADAAKSEKDKPATGTTKAAKRASASISDKADSTKDSKPEKIAGPRTSGPKTSGPKTSGPKTSESKSATSEQVRAEPAPRGYGVVSLFAAALLGGIAGAGVLALAWSYLPMTEQAEAPDLSPLEGRIAKLEAAPVVPSSDAALAKLDGRLDHLEGREPQASPEVAALGDRVSQLEANLKSMAEAAKNGGSVADAAIISQQISEAEKRLDAKIAKGLAGAKSTDAASLEALQKEISGIDAKLKALAKAELSSGDAHLAPEVAIIGERLAKLESALPVLLDAADREAEDTKSATAAIAFANLRAAVSEGRPYVAELATLAALSPGTGDIGGLLDYEDKGIPTLAELTRSFQAAKETALATPATEADDSMLGRLMSSAESLVKIRRVDADAEGDGPGAVLARASAQLKQGDLAATVKEVTTLDGLQKAAFASWLDQARARLGAAATLQRLQNTLLVSLGGNDADAKTPTEKQED